MGHSLKGLYGSAYRAYKNFKEESEMARPLKITYPVAFYHVTSRGNERKATFKSNRDREKFLSYLETAIFCIRFCHRP